MKHGRWGKRAAVACLCCLLLASSAWAAGPAHEEAELQAANTPRLELNPLYSETEPTLALGVIVRNVQLLQTVRLTLSLPDGVEYEDVDQAAAPTGRVVCYAGTTGTQVLQWQRDSGVSSLAGDTEIGTIHLSATSRSVTGDITATVTECRVTEAMLPVSIAQQVMNIAFPALNPHTTVREIPRADGSTDGHLAITSAPLPDGATSVIYNILFDASAAQTVNCRYDGSGAEVTLSRGQVAATVPVSAGVVSDLLLDLWGLQSGATEVRVTTYVLTPHGVQYLPSSTITLERGTLMVLARQGNTATVTVHGLQRTDASVFLCSYGENNAFVGCQVADVHPVGGEATVQFTIGAARQYKAILLNDELAPLCPAAA